MRIDTHLHVMLKSFYGRRPTDPDELLADLSECGLDGGWVSSVDAMTTTDLKEQQLANDALAEMVRKYPGRIEGFCTVNPASMEEAAAEVERCVNQLRLSGVKLHPWLQAFSVTHLGMRLIMETAGLLHVPVLFHDGTPPYSTPRQITWLAMKYPNTQVILGHAGLSDFWRDASDIARLHPNIWLQPSAAPPVTICAAMEGAGPDRILFGSDGGFGTVGFMEYCVAKCRSAVGDELFERMTVDNPVRLLHSRQ